MDLLYPFSANCNTKPACWSAAGKSAERKARLLLEAGAKLTVNSLEFSEQFLIWAEQGQVTLVESEFSADLLAEKWLVIAATDRVGSQRPGLSVRQPTAGVLQRGRRPQTRQLYHAFDYRSFADYGGRFFRGQSPGAGTSATGKAGSHSATAPGSTGSVGGFIAPAGEAGVW
ncbi:Siroheme synthase [Serratia fonticola]|uniref:Siroheme synthase n=1 Tax=Serratia fonticola TaxID=47917 RepID=A0A4U9U955_SERFO|nr:Siroheme synthase [Serratia fonticola]